MSVTLRPSQKSSDLSSGFLDCFTSPTCQRQNSTGTPGIWFKIEKRVKFAAMFNHTATPSPRQLTPAAHQQSGNKGWQLAGTLSGRHSSLILQEIQPCIQLAEQPSRLFGGSRRWDNPLRATAAVLSARGSQQEKTANLREKFHTGPTCWSTPYCSTTSCKGEELSAYTRYWQEKLPFGHKTRAIPSCLNTTARLC